MSTQKRGLTPRVAGEKRWDEAGGAACRCKHLPLASPRSLHCLNPALKGNVFKKEGPLSKEGGVFLFGRTIQGGFGGVN